MSKDISSIIAGWPFESNQFLVRIVRGDDGQDKIQLRLDLGMLQMEFHGRPDGQKPHGSESYLTHYQNLQRAHDRDNPDGKPFVLESTDCEHLMREGLQYYHRYLSFWHLRLFELCARDTKRNLELFTFVRDFAKNTQDKLQFDQWRPYVIMMHAKAVATPLVDLRQWDAAIQVVASGIERIEEFLVEYKQQHKAQQCHELQTLVRWRNELQHRKEQKPPRPFSDDPDPADADPPNATSDNEALGSEHSHPKDSVSSDESDLPKNPAEEGTVPGFSSSASSVRPRKKNLTSHDVLDGLREQLRRAIAEERYEEAARIRDQIAEQERG